MLTKPTNNQLIAYELLDLCNEVYNFNEKIAAKARDLKFKMYGTMFSTMLPMEMLDTMARNISMASENADIASRVYSTLFELDQARVKMQLDQDATNTKLDEELDEELDADYNQVLEINTYKF